MVQNTMQPQTTQPSGPAFKVSPWVKRMLGMQIFLLRRNWMGPMGDVMMVITTTGRKTGNKHSTPIGFVRESENSLIALNRGGQSNWYRNALKNPEVTLEIRGKTYQATTESLDTLVERQHALALYKQQRGAQFERFFGVPVDAPQEALDAAMADRRFVRFHLR